MIDNSDDETDFPVQVISTNRQVSILCKAFTNYLSADIKLSKTQLSKIAQSVGFLGRLLSSLLKIGLLLMENVLQPLAKNILVPLGLKAAASEADAEVHKKP